MANQFSSGKNAIADCDVCGQRYKLKKLKELVVKTKKTNIMACPECWNPDHPQLMVGMYPVEDPQAVRNARPDSNIVDSRNTQWGWAPVGWGGAYTAPSAPNALAGVGGTGSVMILIA